MVNAATQQRYYYGTGKRKTSIAQVRVYPGGGAVVINDRTFEDYFPYPAWQQRILEPFEVTGTLAQFSVVVKVHGGGIISQGDAVRHGIARALLEASAEYRPALKKFGLLTRDARIKEPKKYGLHRARRAPQYTKR